MFNVILFGPPGSGKGTQAERLTEKYGLIHLSTGNLLRDEISRHTALGMEARLYIDKGQLVPDDVVIRMVGNYFDKHNDAKGFLFDGFPRTVAQARSLSTLMQQKGSSIGVVVELVVSEDELVRRLLNRGKTSGRSDDTNEEVVRKRYSVYQKETTPVAGYYQEQGILETVEGEGSIDRIFEAICQAIQERNG